MRTAMKSLPTFTLIIGHSPQGGSVSTKLFTKPNPSSCGGRCLSFCLMEMACFFVLSILVHHCATFASIHAFTSITTPNPSKPQQQQGSVRDHLGPGSIATANGSGSDACSVSLRCTRQSNAWLVDLSWNWNRLNLG